MRRPGEDLSRQLQHADPWQIDNAIGRTNRGAAGALAPNKANPLLNKLDQVAKKLDGGQTNAACGQMGASISSTPTSTMAPSPRRKAQLQLPACSLRDAVATAAGGDTVAVPAGTYGLTLGAIQISKTLTIAGAGARSTKVDENATAQVFVVGSASLRSPSVQISDLTVTNGRTSPFGRGGGIQNFANLAITRCTIANNRAFNGAGILNESGAKMTIRESAITGNQTTGNAGGGIGNSGALNLINSTLYGNTALRNGSSLGGGGGALYNLGNPPAAASFAAVNSTLASNVADPGNGGGLLNQAANVILINTLVSGNLGGNCLALSGVTQTTEHSLDSDGTCGLTGVGDLSGADPLLAALANNGGPTDTQAFRGGSPALDAGHSTVGVCPPTDQRGVRRPPPFVAPRRSR